MPVIRASDAVVHELHGSRFTSYAAPARGSAELCMWRLEVAVGTVGVAHRVSREEVLAITAGTLRVSLGDETLTVGAGDVIVVPAGSLFRVDVVGEEPASAWVTTSVGLEAEMADGTTMAPPWAN